MSQHHHIIGRAVLELNTGDLADVWSLQEEASRVFQQQAVPELERLFDRLVRIDQVVRFDQVIVDVGTIDRRFLADEFLTNLLEQISQLLRDALQNYASNEPSQQKSPVVQQDSSIFRANRLGADWEVLLYFLQYGRFPWWTPVGDWQNWLTRWETVIQGHTHWRIPLQRLLALNATAQQRLVEQFPEPFRQQLMVQMQPNWASGLTLLAQARQLMQTLGLSSSQVQSLERQAWRSLLSEISPAQDSQPFPRARWTRNWLESLVQTYRQEIAPDVLAQRPDFLYQRLRNSLEIIPTAEQSIWLTALNLVVPIPDLPTPRSDLEIWIYFLQQGCLPPGQSVQDWLLRWEAVMQSDDWQEALRAVIIANPIARQRLVDQFPEAFRQQLLERMQSILETVSSSERLLWLTLVHPSSVPFSPGTLESLSDLEIWIYFLQQGHLPLGQSVQDWLARWEAVMQRDTNWQDPLRAVLAANPAARQRLIEQFPEAFRHQLMIQMQPLWIGWYALLDQARQVMQPMNLNLSAIAQLEKQAWLILFSELVQERERLSLFPTSTWIHNWLAQLVQIAGTSVHQSLRSTLEATVSEDLALWLAEVERGVIPIREIRDRAIHSNALSPEEEASGLYITQAGLVLLHPFLGYYFDAIGLLEGDTFRDEIAQQSAIYLLYYLATQQTDAPEYELVFPKLLCGWALDQPLVRGLDLSIAALSEGENLLQAVINHWDVLKNTSPDGLREGFLQRPGKLTHINEGNWKLQVEQTAIDVLLGRLPWGLSMVKLPWMEDLLTVEWH